MASTPQAAPVQPEKGMSEVSRILNVFFDPKKAFADIAARPRFIVPLALGIIVGLAFMISFNQHVGWEHFFRQTIEQSSRTAQMTPEQKEAAIQMQMKIGPIMGYVGAVLGGAVTALIIAGVLLFIFKLLLDTPLNFKQVFAVTCYSFLTGIVSGGLAILVMFLKNPEDFNLQNPLAFNLAAFLNPQTSAKWLQSLGSSIDLFTFWTMALIATGIAACAKKMTWGRAMMGILIPWALWVVVKCGWAAIFA